MLPAPAPRLSRSGGRAPRAGPHCGEHTDEVLEQLGFDAGALRAAGVCG
jgi:crotonobetainyl-CoA:carnitine CoA-transferase CaiB-like acyl-CoA transferase